MKWKTKVLLRAMLEIVGIIVVVIFFIFLWVAYADGATLPPVPGGPPSLPKVLVVSTNVFPLHPRLTLGWNAYPLPVVLYEGGKSGTYTNRIEVGATNQYSFPTMPYGMFYFAVSGRDTNGIESPLSNEISWTNLPITNFEVRVYVYTSPDLKTWTDLTNVTVAVITNDLTRSNFVKGKMCLVPQR